MFGAGLLLAAAARAAPCDDFVRKLPGLSMTVCEAAQLQPVGMESVQARDILWRDIRPPEPELRVLVIGAIHGDEPSSATLLFHWIPWAEQQGGDVHWRFVPVVNPDGVLRGTRVNANGVDLNRNFPTPGWETEAPKYWEQRTRKDPRRWPGPRPMSEPETQLVNYEIEGFKPHLIVSVHAPFGVLDFDGPTQPPRQLGRLFLDQLGVYPGSLGNYGGVHRSVPVVTIELPHADRLPPMPEVRRIWEDLQRWIDLRIRPWAVFVGPSVPMPPSAPAPTDPLPATPPRPQPGVSPSPPAPLTAPASAPASAPSFTVPPIMAPPASPSAPAAAPVLVPTPPTAPSPAAPFNTAPREISIPPVPSPAPPAAPASVQTEPASAAAGGGVLGIGNLGGLLPRVLQTLLPGSSPEGSGSAPMTGPSAPEPASSPRKPSAAAPSQPASSAEPRPQRPSP